MKICFRGATVVTLDDGDSVFHGDVVTDGEKIVYIGSKYSGESDRTIECGGDIVMPSLVNTHTHLGMTVMRNTADDLKLRDWLYKRIFPMEDKLDPEIVRAGARLGAAQLIRGGVTGAVDMYLYPEVIREVLEESGMEGIVCVGDNDLDGDTQGRLKRQEKNLAAATERVRAMPSFHAEYTCSQDYLDGVMELVHAAKIGVACHNSETLEEVGRCCTRHNDLSPTMYLHSLGLLDYGGIMAHCVYCDKEDLALLRQCGCAVSLNSASNLKLGSGIPPIVTMKDCGVHITVGTDSAASNNRLDLWREMYLAAVLPKGVLNSPTAVTAGEVLRWATSGGARAMGMSGGVIEEGGAANLIVVSAHSLGMTPTNDPAAALVYGAGAEDVKLTMCRGEILYENGVFKNGWDEEQLRREGVDASRELMKKIG